MRCSFNIVLPALLLAGTVLPAQAATGLALERAGLGLKRPGAVADSTSIRPWRSEFALAAPAAESATTAYGGLRESTRLGLTAQESFGGIAHAFSDRIAASLELGMMEGTALAPRRYSLTGQLQTAFDSGSSVSIGIAWRVYEPDYGARPGGALDLPPPNGYSPGYSLVPVRASGTGLGPSYQLQLHYQYNPTTTFGLVLGRELETFTAGFDSPGAGSRQFSFTGQHWLTPSWALSYDVLSNDPGSFRLQGLRLGVRYRF
jgi:YaiO family outer membrane protein